MILIPPLHGIKKSTKQTIMTIRMMTKGVILIDAVLLLNWYCRCWYCICCCNSSWLQCGMNSNDEENVVVLDVEEVSEDNNVVDLNNFVSVDCNGCVSDVDDENKSLIESFIVS